MGKIKQYMEELSDMMNDFLSQSNNLDVAEGKLQQRLAPDEYEFYEQNKEEILSDIDVDGMTTYDEYDVDEDDVRMPPLDGMR